jgi:hypothetical protein
MRRSTARRVSSVILFVALPVLLLGCPKKPAPAVEDAAPAAPPPASTPTVTELAPITEDAGEDAAAEAAAPKKWTGGAPAYNANQAKIKECCNAMRAQAKQMGSSPEAFQLNALAGQCDGFAIQVGPQGTAPELAQLRQLLKSIKLPGACQF